MRRTVLVLNGPNLNLLGTRDPSLYGTTTLADVVALCSSAGQDLGLDVEHFQSNHEGELIDRIHQARETTSGVVANLAAYTHTSIALADALAVLAQPVIEVHLTNVHSREQFRRSSYISPVADTVIAGAGVHGYLLALRHVAELLRRGGSR